MNNNEMSTPQILSQMHEMHTARNTRNPLYNELLCQYKETIDEARLGGNEAQELLDLWNNIGSFHVFNAQTEQKKILRIINSFHEIN